MFCNCLNYRINYILSFSYFQCFSEVSFGHPLECYDLLRTLKPDVAAQLHPNNVRKVKKALLDVLKGSIQTKTQTELNENIENVDLGKQVLNRSIKPRYPGESLILWLDCASDVLNTQLNKRVNRMLDSGLVDELDTFLDKVNVLPDRFSETETSDTPGKKKSFGNVFIFDC